MAAELVSAAWEPAAVGEGTAAAGAGPESALPAVPRQSGPVRDGTVADAFDVHLLPVGPVAGYPDADTAAEARAVLDVLRRIGGHPASHPARRPAQAGPAVVDSLGAADDELARWSGEYGGKEERRPKERPSVLVWLGHGRRGSMGPTLLVPGSPERKDYAQVTPDMFAHHLLAEWGNRRARDGHWAIVVIEACKSSDFAAEVRKKFDRASGSGDDAYSILFIATGKGAAQAYLGTFRETLEEYLDGLTSHDKVFPLQDLRRYFKQDSHYAEFGDESCSELRLVLRDRVPLPGATTVAEQQRLQKEFDLTGGPVVEPLEDPERTGFLEVVPHFTGRAAELAEVARWSAEPGPERVLIVPGAPGVGKSAFLGEALRRLRSAGRPGGPRLGVALRLTGSTPEEVRDRLEQVPELRESGVLAGEQAPFEGGIPSTPADSILVVADALDEARDPVRTALMLRAASGHPRVSLIVGTRRAPGGAGDADGSRVDLPTVLGSNTERARVMELLPDPVAAAEYAADGVRRVLREHPVTDPGWAETVAGTVRDAVEQHVRDGSWQFLQASLLVQEIEQNPEVLSPDPAARSALERLLHKDRTGLFGAAVARITRDLPTALPFLRALALAHGRGLPRADGIWLQAATALAAADPTGADRPPDERALTDFLAKAAAYVLLDGEDRRSVYRLAHRTYADRLAADVTAEQRLAVLTALLDLAVTQAAARCPLSPHLESRLAEYAADCGTPGWQALAGHPAVLDRLRIAALCSLALAPGRRGGGAAPTDLPAEVLGTVTSAHLIERSGPDDRPGLRQLGGLRACGSLPPAGDGAAWEVCWGTVRRTPPHLQLDAGQMVTAVSAHPDRPWLVSGSRDGSVMVWEPWRTHAPVLVLSAGDSPVTAVAATGSAGGAGLVVAAYDDRTLHIWPTDGDGPPAPAGEVRLETPHTVWQLAALPDGRFAVAGDAGWLAVLDPGRQRLSPAPSAAGSEVVGLAPVTGPQGQQWLAVAERAGSLTLWDVSADAPGQVDTLSLRRPLAAVTAVAGAELAVACQDGSVWRWDAADRNRPVELLVAPDEAAARTLGASPPVLAAWRAGDTGEVVCGDRRGLWTIGADHLRRPVGGGDAAGIRDVGVLAGPDGGQAVAAVVERSATIHLWDPSVHAADATLSPSPLGRIVGMRRHVTDDGTETLALFQQVRTLGRTETVVRLLRARDGRELTDEAIQAPLAGARRGWDGTEDAWPAPAIVDRAHRGEVRGWVALRGEPFRGVRASAGLDGDVVVWRAEADGAWQPTHRMRLGSTGLGLTALSGGRLAVALRDGVVVLAVAAAAFDSRDEETGDEDV